MRIAICDDEEPFLDLIEAYCNKYSKQTGVDIQLVRFNSGEEFLRYYKEFGDLPIVFMDIMMDGLDGIETSQELRNLDSKINIVFLTSVEKYARFGYKVKALNYLMKPLDYKSFANELQEIIEITRKGEDDFLIVKNDDGIFKLSFNQILYLETMNRKVLIHTKEGEIISYRSLKACAQLLDGRFFRTHLSYIVNMSCIRTTRKFSLVMDNGDIVPISKSRKRNYNSTFARYYGGKI